MEHWLKMGLKKFRNHPSIVKIKSKYLTQEKKFQLVSVKDVEKIIKNFPSNKASGGDIPIQIIKQPWFTFQISTDCISASIKDTLKAYFC